MIGLGLAALAISPLLAAVPTPEEAVFARSVVSTGNTARLQRAFAKAQRGEPVTVVPCGLTDTNTADTNNEHRKGEPW